MTGIPGRSTSSALPRQRQKSAFLKACEAEIAAAASDKKALICDIFYGTDLVHGYGYGQDEDQGQLGAWFVLAGLGLFDVQGGTALHPALQLATPLFDRIRVQLDPRYYAGDSIDIGVRGSPSANRFIQTAAWNGTTLEQCSVPWSQIVRGGSLELVVGNQPATNWGVTVPPPSASTPTP